LKEKSENKFLKGDIKTWDNYPKDLLEKYGSISNSPVFSKQFLLNRQNKNIYKIYSNILGTDKLYVNHDRGCLFRPTSVNENWKTQNNVHLDMNPFFWMENDEKKSDLFNEENLEYKKPNHFFLENNLVCQNLGLQIQCSINFHENKIEDGGFVCVPGFHNHLIDYFSTITPYYGKVSCSFYPKDPIFKSAIRISMRKGAIVLWNQMVPHGSFRNKSNNIRVAQFLKMFPSNTFSDKRKIKRVKLIEKQFFNNNFFKNISDEGEILFDIKKDFQFIKIVEKIKYEETTSEIGNDLILLNSTNE
jgi:hypothetical protein